MLIKVLRVLVKSLTIIFFLILIPSAVGQEEKNLIKSIGWDSNVLEINATQKITYTESREKDPESLTIEITNSRIQDSLVGYEKKLKSSLNETVIITQPTENTARIKFIGSASINRKGYLTNNERTLVLKIARISPEEETTSENEQQALLDKYTPGYIKEITVEDKDTETEVLISATKSIKYNVFLLKNPKRLVVDLLNIIPPEKKLPQYKLTKLVSGIRAGPAASGLDATRVVIDLAQENIEHDVSSSLIGNKLKISFKLSKEKEETSKTPNIKVVIDPGHGGYDTGASYGGFEEKNINLVISEKIKGILESSGINVFLTRDDDSFLSLAERNEITNSIRPNVFISVHGNALKTSRSIRGLETYFWTSQSQKLAYFTHSTILKNLNIPDHYIRKAKFYVIRHTSFPAILLELGFLSNHEDRKLLTNSTTQIEYAKAVTEGILKFLDIAPIKELKDQSKEKEDKENKQS